MKLVTIALKFLFIHFVIYQATLSSPVNPEVHMNVTQVISFYGYAFENHEVTTDDGYILSLQRIPRGKINTSGVKRPVVFLQHGLFGSSFTWVSNRPSGSLGFILADQGFDVWLGNSRGNVYSRNHKTRSPMRRSFWDFTWDEMAQYDLPASVNYVLRITKASKLSYVGHSQGTEIAFAKFSENGPLNRKISAFVALAPVAYLGHVKSGMFWMATTLHLMFQLFNHGEFLPYSLLNSSVAKALCDKMKSRISCTDIERKISGMDSPNLDQSRIPIYKAHVPVGTSSKNIVHYSQSIQSKKFQKYDYGFIRNLYHYHSFRPPLYNLHIIGIPVAIFYGGKDTSSTPEDVRDCIKSLGSAVKYIKFIPNYGHIDLTWAKDAYNVVYKDLVAFLRSNQ